MLFLFFILPAEWRACALLLFSLGYYALNSPNHLVLAASLIVMEWAALIVMERFDDSPIVRKICLAFSGCKNIGLLLWFGSLTGAGGVPEQPPGLVVIALSGFWCTLDVYRRRSPYLQNPLYLALYLSFFPRLYGGPLMRYQDFAAQLTSLNPTFSQFLKGWVLYLQGIVKFNILSNILFDVYNSLRSFPPDEQSVLGTWILIFILALQVFFRLSGLSEMARGFGGMMGISLPQDFYYPYQSRSIKDFSGRFLMGTVRFWRDVFPAQKEESRLRLTIRVLLIGVCCGLWFGLRQNYLAWGLYLAALSLIERAFYPKITSRVPLFFRRVFTFLAILLSFPIFAAENLSGALDILSKMFWLTEIPFAVPRLGYLISSNWLLIAVSILFSVSAVSLGAGFLSKRFPKTAGLVSLAASAGMLVLLTAFSV
jgi:alginate O-acetyltransferase complex protein AlgI